MPSLYDDTTAGLPQTTLNGIYYEIDVASYREQWVPGNNKTEIMCRVDANDAFDWITSMVGQSYVNGSTTLRRDLPEQNPFDENQWCTKIEQIDQGGENEDETFRDVVSGWPFTRWCRYKATFESLLYKVRSDTDADSDASGLTVPELLRYVTRSQTIYAREQQIPGGGFKAVGGTDKLMQTGFKTRSFGDVTYCRIRVPCGRFPAEFRSHRGKINDDTFDAIVDGDEYAFSAGELLYVGYDDSNKYWDANEDWVCDVVLKFKYCQGGWNYFFNNLGTLVEVSSNGTAGGTKPYSTADFDLLFTVD